MASHHPVISSRLASLKEAAFGLSSRINTHIEAPESKNRSVLKSLVAELRLLGGTIHSLQILIRELVGFDDDFHSREACPQRQKIEWPFIDGFELLLDALRPLFPYSTPQGLAQAKTALDNYRSKLNFIVRSSESLDDISLHFSVLGKEPLPDLTPPNAIVPEYSTENHHHLCSFHEDNVTPEVVSSWLTILNSTGEDREPREHWEEKVLIQARRSEVPRYSTAATKWPQFAESFWTKLRPQICSLFRMPKSQNFVQWVLEYAREKYPQIFGRSALSPRTLLDLTDALCDGSVSALHMAAALGLPSLCRDLLSMGADVNQIGLLGSPLYCALVGPRVLATRAEPESWVALLDGHQHEAHRAATILQLIDKGADCRYLYRWKNGGEASIAGLAFWVALITKHESVFREVAGKGALLESGFAALLCRGSVLEQGLRAKPRLERLLTLVYDSTMPSGAVPDTSNDMTSRIRELTRQIIKGQKLSFSFPQGCQRLDLVPDSSFDGMVVNAILDGEEVLLQRLSHDPRFNPSHRLGDSQDSFSLLHFAVEGSKLEMIDILVKAGASLDITDSVGRTPLMVVESTATLAKLMQEYGATTTNVDITGRTIWHFAAASNDASLLKYLIENDPNKEKCLAMVTDNDITPLGEALFYINSLKSLPHQQKPTLPIAARLLVKEYREVPPGRLGEHFYAAVRWGDMDLLDGLLKLEPNFWERDAQGRTMLHYLNPFSSERFTSRVLELCKGLPIHTRVGATPAETILTNIPLLKAMYNKNPVLSDHPACHGLLKKEVYSKLLTPEVLQYQDSNGRGVWQRFCASVLPIIELSSDLDEPLVLLMSSIRVAVSCLTQNGALADYERDTGESALVCFLRGARDPRLALDWPLWKISICHSVLDASRNKATQAFLESVAGARLFLDAVCAEDIPFMNSLVQRGVPIHEPVAGPQELSPIERLLCNSIAKPLRFEALMKHANVEVIQARQHLMVRHLRALSGYEDGKCEIIKKLLERGILDINRVAAPGESTLTLLNDAIMSHDMLLLDFLLKNGADPSLGTDGYDALMAVAESGFAECLPQVTHTLDDDYDYGKYYDSSGRGRTFSSLQMAAAQGNNSTLEMMRDLLDDFGRLVNVVTPRNPSPPLHLAIVARSIDCVKTLVSNGADVHMQDGDGLSPLRVALRERFVPAIDFLLYHATVDDEELDFTEVRAAAVLDDVLAVETAALVGRHHSFKKSREMSTGATRTRYRTSGRTITSSIDAQVRVEFAAGRHAVPIMDLFDIDGGSAAYITTAILPCSGCSPISYAIRRGALGAFVPLATRAPGGYITGCSHHWPLGFNAIVSMFFGVDTRRFGSRTHEECRDFLQFLKVILNVYLDAGILWLYLPCTPIHALCATFRVLREDEEDYHEVALKIILSHLERHSERYWSLIKSSGMEPQLRDDDTQDITGKVLSIAVNARGSDKSFRRDIFGHNLTPLHLLTTASHVGQDTTRLVRMAAQLLDADAEMDAQSSRGCTALHGAIFHGLEELTRLLLSYGADPNIRDYNGNTALALGAMLDMSGPSMDLLIKKGAETFTLADIGISNTRSVAPLNAKQVLRLADMGLNSYAKDYEPSLMATLVLEGPEASSILNSPCHLHPLIEEWPLVLNKAIRSSHNAQQIKILIKSFPRSSHHFLINSSPLGHRSLGCGAILQTDTGPLEVLIDLGLDLEKECSSVGTPLMYACNQGRLQAVQILVRRGARLLYITTDDSGRPLVRSALQAAQKHRDVMHWLLIDRHREGKRLGWTVTADRDTPIKQWSGPRRIEYFLPGLGGQYQRLLTESSIQWLSRLDKIRAQLYGKVVPSQPVTDIPVEIFDGHQPDNTVAEMLG